MPKWPLAPVVILLVLLGAAPPTAADYEAERLEMVRVVELEAAFLGSRIGVSEIDPAILEAMRTVPRHAFVPLELQSFAYGNHPLPVGHEQNLAAPLLVALMTHLVAPKPTDIVFETGTGAGYHAAVLSLLVREVYSVEVVDPLAMRARTLLADLNYRNVETMAGDGYYGWPGQEPFDAILVKEALDHIPVPLLNQLKPGGRMVIPLGPPDGPQVLTVVLKSEDGKVQERRIMPVRFSPLQGGVRL